MHRELATALPSIIGKTIAHVVVKEGRSPHTQLFLVFADGTNYELFSSQAIEGSAEIDKRGLPAVLAYSSPQQAVVFQC